MSPSPILTLEDELIFIHYQQLLDYVDYVRNVVTDNMYAELPLTFTEWLKNNCPDEPTFLVNLEKNNLIKR